ncbi:hypothetical protein A2U01_0038928 [Trifolium medium]|uniref:Uncharacterized protein n=1 Tax=Trifolium medium TaxID=97028 RepID=A0A392Q1B7_9FABA|nr:hypothetical protein [Trifolium medium]
MSGETEEGPAESTDGLAAARRQCGGSPAEMAAKSLLPFPRSASRFYFLFLFGDEWLIWEWVVDGGGGIDE